MEIIDSFISRFSREFDYYQQLARMCQERCEITIEQSGVRAIVTSRAKQPGRLRAKLVKRNESKLYTSLEAVYHDIVDLAGVRIALYFPDDRHELDKLIKNLFNILQEKEFPETMPRSTRFSGYHAKHYRVQLKEETLNEPDKRYAQGKVEIQVASVLMHAWAEVNHDLVYKPLAGALSSVESNMLENLNGLVMSGEVSLETLQQALKKRVSEAARPFSNHFELAALLYDRAETTFAERKAEPLVGRVDILYSFLKEAALNIPSVIEEGIANLWENQGDETIAQRLIDNILSKYPNLSETYLKVKREAGERNPYRTSGDIEASPNEQALGMFMKRWGILEGVFHSIGRKVSDNYEKRWHYGEMQRIASDLLDEGTASELRNLLGLRTEAVHGDKTIDKERLTNGARSIEIILRSLKERDNDFNDIIQDAIRRMEHDDIR